MNSIFNKRFEEEVLLSEKLRTKILACVFFTAMTATATNLFIVRYAGTNELNKHSMHLILYFQASLFLFELTSLLYIRRKIKTGSLSIPIVGQYINALVEISAPVMAILSMSQQCESPVMVLHSPVVYVYFLFIILSTLRLNFRI